MAQFVPKKMGTLLVPSGPKDGKHLFVILTDKCLEGFHLLVNFSTIKEGQFHDPACVISPGEHPFIKERSYIEYRMARKDKAEHLVKCVSGWYFKEMEPVSIELYKRICEGVMKSEFTQKWAKKYFSDQQSH